MSTADRKFGLPRQDSQGEESKIFRHPFWQITALSKLVLDGHIPSAIRTGYFYSRELGVFLYHGIISR